MRSLGTSLLYPREIHLLDRRYCPQLLFCKIYLFPNQKEMKSTVNLTARHKCIHCARTIYEKYMFNTPFGYICKPPTHSWQENKCRFDTRSIVAQHIDQAKHCKAFFSNEHIMNVMPATAEIAKIIRTIIVLPGTTIPGPGQVPGTRPAGKLR